jgi:hypothetical protein
VNSVGDHVRRQLPHHHRLQILDPERFREVARYYENIEAGSFAICVSDDGRSVSDLVATAYDGFYFTEIDALTSDLDQAVCAANEFGQAVLAQPHKIAGFQERKRRGALENIALQAPILPIPEREISAADDEFTNFFGSRGHSSLVDQSDRHVGEETAAWHP